jgi:hypothetical protein
MCGTENAVLALLPEWWRITALKLEAPDSSLEMSPDVMRFGSSSLEIRLRVPRMLKCS